MATMWTHPVRHPWFDRPTRKRKATENVGSSTAPGLGRSKRRRCDSLESGFSQLSLENSLVGSDESSTLRQSPIIHPSSVEEPEERPTDVKMTSSFSYEPEKDRIIITSLDDSDSESEEPSTTSEFEISPAFLDRVRKGTGKELFTLSERPRTESLALVLYRPPLVPSEEEEEIQGESGAICMDENAMDVDE